MVKVGYKVGRGSFEGYDTVAVIGNSSGPVQ